MSYARFGSFTARDHAYQVIRAAIAKACPEQPDMHDPAATAVVGLFSNLEWERTEFDQSTYGEPDKVMPIRYVTADFGHQTGTLTWEES